MQSMPSYYTAAYAPLSPYPATVSEVTSSPNTGSTVLTIQTPPRALATNTEQETTAPTSAKRNQVKNACTNCQKACKKCDDARPCPRCIKYGVSDTCVNSVRKERKKGIKRGPYKRRQKNGEEGSPLVKSEAATATTPTTSFKIREPVAVSAVTTAASSTPVDYGYPTNLSQYAQSYETYQQYAAAAAVAVNNTSESKDVYIVAPAYPGFNNEDGNAYFTLPPQGPPPPPGVYFQKEKKQQPMTPVPSTSNSSGTTSPSETPHDDEDTKFARLTQLCSAALRENKEAEAATQAAQQQKELKQEQE